VSRRSTALLAAGVVLLAGGCGGGGSPAARRPDVVLIVVDTLRADRLSCYGYGRPTSPNLDRFAEEGAVFLDTTSQWPWTLPSMVTIFQGRYITNYRDRLEEDLPSLPELFRDAGYRTVGIVANCSVDEGQGFSRGFERFDICRCWVDEEETDHYIRDIGEIEGLLPRMTADLLEGESRAPLFLYIHAYEPHSPYREHEEYAETLPADEAFGVQPEGWREATIAELGPPPPRGKRGWDLEFEAIDLNRGRYDQEVRWFDEGLGRIVERLRGLGLDDEALFALAADHGEGLWEHLTNDTPESLREAKPGEFFYQLHGGNGYEPVMATPLVIWGGRVPPARRVEAPVENIDLFPTLLELADIELPAGLHGRSLVPLLQAEPPTDWREFVFCYGSHNLSVRHAPTGWKLVLPHGLRSEITGRQPELYKLDEDPYERSDRAAEHPDLVAWLVAEAGAWMERHPTTSTMKGRMSDINQQGRERLAEKLRALGYTELETGIPASDD
jgi:arylsulfatase A-like enzyme